MAKQNQPINNNDISSCWKLYFKMNTLTSTKISLMKCGSLLNLLNNPEMLFDHLNELLIYMYAQK